MKDAEARAYWWTWKTALHETAAAPTAMKYRYRRGGAVLDELITRCLLDQKESARKNVENFKEDPFDRRLRTHKIQAAFRKPTVARLCPLKLKAISLAVYLDGENRRLTGYRHA